MQLHTYRLAMDPVLKTLARYINDAPDLMVQQAQRRGDRIQARAVAAAGTSPSLIGVMTVQTYTQEAVADTERAVRDWYRFRDPDRSNRWLFYADWSLTRARRTLKRVVCAESMRTATPIP